MRKLLFLILILLTGGVIFAQVVYEPSKTKIKDGKVYKLKKVSSFKKKLVEQGYILKNERKYLKTE